MLFRIAILMLALLSSSAQSQAVPYELKGVRVSIGEPESSIKEKFSHIYVMEYSLGSWVLRCRQKDITGTNRMVATISTTKDRVTSITEYIGDECGRERNFPWSVADGLEKASNAMLKVKRFSASTNCVIGQDDGSFEGMKGFTVQCGRYLLTAKYNPELPGNDLVTVEVR